MYLHHHCVIVQDMDEALKIFCDYLGMKLVKRVEGFGNNLELAFIEEPKTGPQIELFSRLPVDIKNQGSGTLDHLAFLVDDVDQSFNELKEKDGLEVDKEPYTIDKYNARMAFLKDNNGFRIQLVNYL